MAHLDPTSRVNPSRFIDQRSKDLFSVRLSCCYISPAVSCILSITPVRMFEALGSVQGRREALAELLLWEKMLVKQFLPWQPARFFRYHRDSYDTLFLAQRKYQYVRHLQRAFRPPLEHAGWNRTLQHGCSSHPFSHFHDLAQHDLDIAFQRSREETTKRVLKTAIASLAVSFILFLMDVALFEILGDPYKDFMIYLITLRAEPKAQEAT
jgi:hypothetical protein